MKRCLPLFFILFTGSVGAQENYKFYSYNDAQVWFNLYLEKKVSDKFYLHLNQQDRWTNNVSQFNFGYADMGVTYKITKNIKVMADYVFTQKVRDDRSFSTYHQYYLAATIKKDIGRWRVMYRAMFQFQYNNPYTSDFGSIPFYYDRNKFIVKYEFNKYFSYYAAEELYIPLNSPQVKGIDRTRTFVGMFYNINKHQQLELYFMYQDRLQNGSWFKQHKAYDSYNYLLEKDFVYGIGYSFSF